MPAPTPQLYTNFKESDRCFHLNHQLPQSKYSEQELMIVPVVLRLSARRHVYLCKSSIPSRSLSMFNPISKAIAPVMVQPLRVPCNELCVCLSLRCLLCRDIAIPKIEGPLSTRICSHAPAQPAVPTHAWIHPPLPVFVLKPVYPRAFIHQVGAARRAVQLLF